MKKLVPSSIAYLLELPGTGDADWEPGNGARFQAVPLGSARIRHLPGNGNQLPWEHRSVSAQLEQTRVKVIELSTRAKDLQAWVP